MTMSARELQKSDRELRSGLKRYNPREYHGEINRYFRQKNEFRDLMDKYRFKSFFSWNEDGYEKSPRIDWELAGYTDKKAFKLIMSLFEFEHLYDLEEDGCNHSVILDAYTSIIDDSGGKLREETWVERARIESLKQDYNKKPKMYERIRGYVEDREAVKKLVVYFKELGGNCPDPDEDLCYTKIMRCLKFEYDFNILSKLTTSILFRAYKKINYERGEEPDYDEF